VLCRLGGHFGRDHFETEYRDQLVNHVVEDLVNVFRQQSVHYKVVERRA
jgi:hypothetical protein